MRNLPWMNRSKLRLGRETAPTEKLGHSSLWFKYVLLRNEVVQLLRQSKKNHLERMSNLGSKQFWKAVKYLMKTSSQVPTLKNGATETSSNTDKASLLNEVFFKNFNNTFPPLSEFDQQCFIADPLASAPRISFALSRNFLTY